MHKVVIIGSGQVGQTLGYLLHRSKKYKIVGVWSRQLNNAKKAARFIGKNVRIFNDKSVAALAGDIIFITTPDSAIQQVAQDIFSGNTVFENKVVLHCSGSLSSDILRSAKKHTLQGRGKNVFIASFHPLQTFANKLETVKNFRGTYCVYEGEPKALSVVKEIIRTIEGIPVGIKAKNKTLYHIGCVLACNYPVTLISVANEFLKRCGFKHKDIFRAIQPLIDSTIKNIKTIGIPSALTGPIARGDILTIKKHLKSIKKELPLYLPLYCELGKHTIKIAEAKKKILPSQLALLRKEMNI
ncbi:MAG: Rossmann-like and DUF2520 domain-containing protein [Planctomycetota bacterium]